MRDIFQQRCSQILGFPPELLAYQRWLDVERAKPRQRDYLFSEAQQRFEPRKEDVVIPLPGLHVDSKKGRCQLRAESLAAPIELPGFKPRDAQKVLASFDGNRCLAEARWEAGVEAQIFSQFLRLTFGLVTFAPSAVAELEYIIPCTEITRFPCAPYAIERSYWSNMADVRTYAESADIVSDMLDGIGSFERRLREMHVLALMGRSLGSFYKPASPVSDDVVAPGVLYLDTARIREGVAGTVFLDGPRANVSFVGGEGYHRAIYASLGDEEAMASDRVFERDGLSWGRCIWARSHRDEHPGSWFCPPRPVSDGHFELMLSLLRAGYRAAGEGDAKEAVRSVAGFHQAFVRLHPFHCANQCIAMNLANMVLRRACGSGIPHLLLDHFALRMSESAYERLFARAVREYATGATDPATRLKAYMDKKTRSFAIIQLLGKARTSAEVAAIVNNDTDGAKFALISDD